MDLLDRTIIIKTEPYKEEDIQKILGIRCQEEEAEMSPDALSLLTKIGTDTSLRYAANLISVSYQISRKRRASSIGIEDIKRSYMLFLDSARSVEFLEQNSSSYINDNGKVTLGEEDTDKMDTSK